MSDNARPGLGLIGIGSVGLAHLNALANLERAELIDYDLRAVCDNDAAVLKSASEIFNIKTAFTNYRDLISKPDVDVIFVMTPTNKHGDIIKAAAKAGKAVYSKKPLAHSAPQARDLNAVVIDHNVPSGVGLVLRHDPFVLYARSLLDKHDFGRPMSAHIRTDQRLPEGVLNQNGIASDVEVPGRGTLVEQSIHDLDLLSWFFGTPKSVSAKFGFFSGSGLEDLATVVLEHEGGTISTLNSIWHSIDRVNERRIEFFFENGFIGITLESGKNKLDYQIGDEAPVRIHPETADLALLDHLGIDPNNLPSEAYDTLTSGPLQRYAAASYCFLNAVKSGNMPVPNFMDAVSVHNIVDAAYESANRGTPVELL